MTGASPPPPAPSPTVTPRRPGEPEVDHTVLRLVHRAMLADAARFAALLTDLARGNDPIGRRRAVAVRDHLVALAEELHQHHNREDDICWPVIAASAGSAVDLAPLTEDHAELAPLIDAVDAAAREFAVDPEVHVGGLARRLRELSALLHEHIRDEERDVLPVISRYVSVADWAVAEQRMRAGAGPRHLAWALPWVASFAEPDELAHVMLIGGVPFRLLLALFRPAYRRRVRRIFPVREEAHP